MRDCKAWKDENLSLSTTSNEAAKFFDSALTQYVTWLEDDCVGGIEGACEKMTEADPNFVMGNVIALGLELMATGRTIRLDSEFAQQFKNLEDMSKNATPREKLHCKAVCEWSKEHYANAHNTWEEILVDYPNDLLALKFAHDAYFYLGESQMIRDSVARVLPSWKESNPFYGYLKGMHAFGLEETNLYSDAEKAGREALKYNKTDCWATHALAHCYEMTGKQSEGADFMALTESDWSQGGMLACHNYWHWSLYHLEMNNHPFVLDIYDQQIQERSTKSGAMLDVVDAASILLRLELDGVDVGSRWDAVHDLCRPHIDDHIMVFNDCHFLMSYLGSKKDGGKAAKDFIASVEKYLKGEDEEADNQKVCKNVGFPIMQALVAFKEERYDDAAELLYPVKNDVVKIGGSHAQRDVFAQLLLHSCIRSSKRKNQDLARALIRERKCLKRNAPLTDRMHARHLLVHEAYDL